MHELRKLPPDLAEKATKVLNEDEDRIKEDLKYIKEWLSKQPHLNVRLNDQWLVTFLRGCKYSLERTKFKLDWFYTLRTLLPEFFKDKDPTVSPLRELIHRGLFLPLENRTDSSGPALLFFRQGYYDSSVEITNIFKYIFIILDIMMMESDNLAVSGLIVICDLAGVTLTHMAQFTPGIAKKSVTTVQEGYPIRQKGAHFINVPTGFDTLFNLLKTFASEKIRKRYHVHKSIETLYAYVPQKNLPLEYGGEAGSFSELTDRWQTKVNSYKNWLIEDEEYFSDERLRPGKPKTTETLFGIDGSFRKLSID